jgi:ABC-2 type transport system permease protein
MSRVWLIARHQFGQEASKRSFWLLLLMLPLFMTLMIGYGYVISLIEEGKTALGFVDPAGFIVETEIENADGKAELIEYPSEDSAEAALKAEDITAYYVLSTNFARDQKAEYVYVKHPPSRVTRYFNDVLRSNLLAGQAPEVVERSLSGANVTIRATEINREYKGGNPNVGHFLPLIGAAIVIFLVMTTSGYMTEVLVEEKVNRTMEIMISSVSTSQMMAGKILGGLAIAFLQLVTWLVFLIGAVWLGANVLEVSWLQEMTPVWPDVGKVIVVALPVYLFIASLMSILGSMVSDSYGAQQAGPIGAVTMFLPVYLLEPIITNPNGPLAIFLTLFPTTSVLTVALRSLVEIVPGWQIATSAGITLVLALATIWLAGKVFRMNMLRYGKPVKIREMLSRKKVVNTS